MQGRVSRELGVLWTKTCPVFEFLLRPLQCILNCSYQSLQNKKIKFQNCSKTFTHTKKLLQNFTKTLRKQNLFCLGAVEIGVNETRQRSER